MSIIFGTSGQGKQLARTTPIQVTGLKAVGENGGVALSIDPPSEASYAYLKDYWVTFKKASEGAILHPYDGQHMVFPKGEASASGQPLSALAVGSTLKIAENGVPVQFLVLQHVYPNADSANTLLLRKDLVTQTSNWKNANSYPLAFVDGPIDGYLNNDYLSLLGASVKSLIPEITIACTIAPDYVSANPTTISRKIFLLSATELGGSKNTIPVEGTHIAYFDSDEKRIATRNSIAADWWTRTPVIRSSARAMLITASGLESDRAPATQLGIRPAFCLPNDTLVSEQPDADGDYTLLA